jgi:hypothetical protein
MADVARLDAQEDGLICRRLIASNASESVEYVELAEAAHDR